MGKLIVTLLASMIGGLSAVGATIFFVGWGVPLNGQTTHLDPTRSDYVDLLLTLVTVLLGAIGLAVTVGALVIGMVALKTLKEIKEEAASNAKNAAAQKITETIAEELVPNVQKNIEASLPEALQTALLDDAIGHEILSKMAKDGELDDVFERVVARALRGEVGKEGESDEELDE